MTTAYSRRIVPLLALLALLALVFAACGDDDDETSAGDTTDTTAETTTSAAGGSASGAAVTIKGFAFSPATAKAGAEVTVTNEDSAPHTVTADEGDAFDTGNVDAGSSKTFTAPDQPGTYAFHCNIHQNMKGTLTVT